MNTTASLAAAELRRVPEPWRSLLGYETLNEIERVCATPGCDRLTPPTDHWSPWCKRCQRSRSIAERLIFTPRPGPLDTPCHIFHGTISTYGYGRAWADRKLVGTHRLSWEIEHGPIPDGLHVLHRCDVPACINVEHLFLGTQTDNMRDMDAKGRRRGQLVPGNNRTPRHVEQAVLDHIANGMPKDDIASRVGVCRATVYNIARRSGGAR